MEPLLCFGHTKKKKGILVKPAYVSLNLGLWISVRKNSNCSDQCLNLHVHQTVSSDYIMHFRLTDTVQNLIKKNSARFRIFMHCAVRVGPAFPDDIRHLFLVDKVSMHQTQIFTYWATYFPLFFGISLLQLLNSQSIIVYF